MTVRAARAASDSPELSSLALKVSPERPDQFPDCRKASGRASGGCAKGCAQQASGAHHEATRLRMRHGGRAIRALLALLLNGDDGPNVRRRGLVLLLPPLRLLHRRQLGPCGLEKLLLLDGDLVLLEEQREERLLLRVVRCGRRLIAGDACVW